MTAAIFLGQPGLEESLTGCQSADEDVGAQPVDDRAAVQVFTRITLHGPQAGSRSERSA